MPQLEDNRRGREWSALVRKNGTDDFRRAFAKDAVLEASVLNGPLVGVEQIGAFFAATSDGMYESLAFTGEVAGGDKTCLEWEGRAFGKAVGGVTVITRDGDGLISSVHLHHRPLPVVVAFSKEIATRLRGKVDDHLLSFA